jgi:hypothetical protein
MPFQLQPNTNLPALYQTDLNLVISLSGFSQNEAGNGLSFAALYRNMMPSRNTGYKVVRCNDENGSKSTLFRLQQRSNY